MGFKYKDLAKSTKDTTVDVGDEAGSVVHVTYRHAFITPALTADMALLGAAEGKIERLPSAEQAAVAAAIGRAGAHIAQLVTRWDLEGDEEGEMFPLDAGAIATKLPIDFQMRVLGTCIRESRAGEA